MKLFSAITHPHTRRLVWSALYVAMPVVGYFAWKEQFTVYANWAGPEGIFWETNLYYSRFLVPLYAAGALFLNVFLDAQRVEIEGRRRPLIFLSANIFLVIVTGILVVAQAIFILFLWVAAIAESPNEQLEPSIIGIIGAYWPIGVVFSYSLSALVIKSQQKYLKTQHGVVLKLIGAAIIPTAVVVIIVASAYAGMVFP